MNTIAAFYPLIACAVFALGLLFYVFAVPGEISSAPVKDRLAYLKERKDVIYENLRDLNFENKAGKFSEQDYQSLRTSLEQEAAQVLSEISLLEGK